MHLKICVYYLHIKLRINNSLCFFLSLDWYVEIKLEIKIERDNIE